MITIRSGKEVRDQFAMRLKQGLDISLPRKGRMRESRHFSDTNAQTAESWSKRELLNYMLTRQTASTYHFNGFLRS